MYTQLIFTDRTKASILLALAAFGWGTNTIASKLAVGEVSPMMLIFVRWVIVASLLCFLYWKPMKIAWPLVKSRLIWVLLMGGLGLSVFNALFYMSAHYTTALNLGIIQSIMPAMILLGSLLVWKIKITKLQIVGLCLTFAGAVFIITKGQPIKILSLSVNIGDLLMLTACIFYAGYTVGLKGRPNISGTVMMAYFSIAALLMTLPLVIIEAIFFKSVYPSQNGLLIIAYIAFVPSFLSQIFFMRGVDVIGPNSSGLYANLVPIFSTILSVLLLNEALQSFHLVSLVMVFCGIYIFEIKAQRKNIN